MISPTPPAPFVDDEPREIEEPMQGQHFAGVAVAAAPPAASSEQHRPAPACSLYTTTQRELDEHPISPQNRSHTLRDPDLPSQIDLQPQIDLPITTARPPSPAMTDKIEKGDQGSCATSVVAIACIGLYRTRSLGVCTEIARSFVPSGAFHWSS